jgi:hypothetical protein
MLTPLQLSATGPITNYHNNKGINIGSTLHGDQTNNVDFS